MSKKQKGIVGVYSAGYFMPLEPIKGHFDVQADNVLIAKGSHFFCNGHLAPVVVEEQSRNRKYCVDCYRAMKENGLGS